MSYSIDDFSPELSAVVTVQDPTDSRSRGRVDVLERKTSRRLVSVAGEGLPLEADLPASGPMVVYQDFDFDGRPDLAVRDGNNSCYGGPSFQVFLRRGASFRASAGFTELAQLYCGMFEVDAAQRRLRTFSKSGMAVHAFQTFDVVRGAPRKIQDQLEDYAQEPGYLTTTYWSLGSQPSVEYTLLPPGDGGEKPLFAFELGGGRRVVVLASQRRLDYVLVSGSDHVDFSYRLQVPHARAADAPPFEWDAERAELSFRNGAYRYVIHDSSDRLGVSVYRRGHETFLPGQPATRVGTLAGLPVKELDNVRALRRPAE